MLHNMMASPAPRTRRPDGISVHPNLPVLPVSIAFFDLSLTSTGVALYKEDHITTELCTPRTRGVARLKELDDWIRWFLIRECPQFVGVEGYSFASKGSRAHSIGEWGGVAKLAIKSRPRTTSFIASPKTIKKFMGNGNATKTQMGLWLLEKYGITIMQEDEADAACGSILIGAHLYAGSFASLTQSQHDAIAGIEPMT